MKEILENLALSNDLQELYSGVLDTLEGLVRGFPADTWRNALTGDGSLSREITQTIYDAGLMGLGVEEEHGGMGGGLLGQVLLYDVLAQHGFISLSAVLTGFCREPVLNFGTPAQIEKFAVPSISGEKSFCILATEPNAGTNTFNNTTRAVKKGNKWILNGQKIYTTEAARTDYGFLIAKTGDEQRSGLSIFMLDMKSPGIDMTELNISIAGGEKQYQVFFDNVEMPEDALIGEEGRGGKYMFSGLNAERLLIAAMTVGISDIALRETTKYVKERVLFGDRPTGSYQAVQHPLAQAKADTEGARLLMYLGAKQYDDGKDAGKFANMAKLQSSIAATNMCDAAIQFHGGSGMDEDTGMLALWRSARAIKIAPLNNEMILNYIAEHVVGLPRSY